MKNVDYNFDAETGVSTVKIEYDGKIFEGRAEIDEEDRPFMSEKTGLTIAEFCATLRIERYKLSKIPANDQDAINKQKLRIHALDESYKGYLKGKKDFRSAYAKLHPELKKD